MLIQEIKLTAGDAQSCPMIHISIDGKEYMLLSSGRGSVTVIAGRQWINSRRTLGKTFWKAADLTANYKKHGAELLAYANRLTGWAN
jgi:hypothetical protein